MRVLRLRLLGTLSAGALACGLVLAPVAQGQTIAAPGDAPLVLPFPPEAEVTLPATGNAAQTAISPDRDAVAPAAAATPQEMAEPIAGEKTSPEPKAAETVAPDVLPVPVAAEPAAPVEPSRPVAASPLPETVIVPVATAPLQLELPPDVPAMALAMPLNDSLKRALEMRVKEDLPASAHSQNLGPGNMRRDREAIRAFYEGRQFAPLWIADGHLTEAARAAVARLAHAADDGLDLRLSPSPVLTPSDGADKMVAAEVMLAEAVVAYGRQASGVRVDPQRISNLITQKPEIADVPRILGSVANAGADAGNVLLGFNPPQKGYAQLRSKLLEIRREQRPVVQTIAPGPILRVGMRDPRVPLIRSRFGLDVAVATDPADVTYDTRVANAVADFQRANGLPASGILTARTIAALSGGEPSRLENEILANMERWRWMPRDLGKKRIEVNVPSFTAQLIDGETPLYSARVVVGKTTTQTPIFSNVMQFMIVNPYWNVPQSIIQKEMLPKLAGDPEYLHRLGYEMVRRGNLLTVRQPPGERNALGQIKFMFPNDHAVYLHDTPSRALFANVTRAFSHGCVRVDKPFQFAEAILGAGWSEARVKSLIGGPERKIDLPQHLPIHIEYFTAEVDWSGRLQLRDDVYGYSRRLKIAMGLES